MDQETNETDCQIDQKLPLDKPCPRCGAGPCLNGGFVVHLHPEIGAYEAIPMIEASNG